MVYLRCLYCCSKAIGPNPFCKTDSHSLPHPAEDLCTNPAIHDRLLQLIFDLSAAEIAASHISFVMHSSHNIQFRQMTLADGIG